MTEPDDDDDRGGADGGKGRWEWLRSTPPQVWLLGLALPIAIAIYGLTCLAARSASFLTIRRAEHWWQLDSEFSRIGLVQYQGAPAVGLGFAYISLACFLHFYVFESWFERAAWYGKTGKVIAAFGFTLGMFYFILKAIADSFW